MTVDLFPFQQYWWVYAAFTAFVLLLLALDLGVFHREAREVRIREAATWCAVWVGLALAFAYGLYRYALWRFPRDPRLAALPGFDPTGAARDTALEFLTGYIVEYSSRWTTSSSSSWSSATSPSPPGISTGSSSMASWAPSSSARFSSPSDPS